ncbi:MAG: Na+/H+ antiporter NhaC [Xylanivirga thermophila]|jgi:Na+:H+ antiporter, NhaC family|uniref:Na+/H+ antiporter NhaC n=1 Tax=Xylanivirga thermophila TaxID=2496273 RepID=UPI00101C175A|nr:Na+/H+ antiporter NhaC [Xylanivirga thermophila]
MFRIKPKIMPSWWEAILLTIGVLTIIGLSIICFDSTPHIPVVISILILIFYGLAKGLSFRDLEHGMIEGASTAIGAIFLFFFIGILISSWLISGTIPTLMTIGLNLVIPHFYYAVIFVITSITGLCIGSSLTTAATIGAAFIGISSALGFSLPITAGAVVSGAFFGDKMSPLSDTTNLASSIADVDLFEHINNMKWTTFPAFCITLVIFALLSPTASQTRIGQLDMFKNALLKTGMVHWYSLIPLVILVFLSIKKVPAVITLAISSISAIALSFLHMQGQTVSALFSVLYSGYVSQTGNQAVDALLTRGGIESMMFTVSLIILALSMGGLLFVLGIIPKLLLEIESKLNSIGSIITATAVTGIMINFLTGEQYLSILLTGETYQSQFEKIGLESKNLSRVLEDAGTVVNPLVPWGVCGTFLTNVLGVSTIQYAPFAFFCILCPILTTLYGWTGWTITKKE